MINSIITACSIFARSAGVDFIYRPTVSGASRRCRRWAAALLLPAAALLAQESPAAGDAAPPRPVAFVAGNAAYRFSPSLRNPVNDAVDMAKALRELGFSVTLATDIESRDDMRQRIEDWAKTISPNGVALFYYSGHGAQEAGENYLIPIRARILSASDLPGQAVGLDYVMDAMSSEDDVHVNIIILDACRSPMARDAARGLAPVIGARGTYISYATAPGQVASDGRGRHGLFTEHLLQRIKTSGASIEEMMRLVRGDVIADPGNDMKQRPWDASSLTVRFSFSPEQLRPAAARSPKIKITTVPISDPKGGEASLVMIGGQVIDGDPAAQCVVLYAQTNRFYIQPDVGVQTEFHADGSWKRGIHAGSRYAAFLVPKGFAAPATLADLALIPDGALDFAVADGLPPNPAPVHP